MLAADPIHVGVVYLETDYLESDLDSGGDSRGDRFIVSFVGGAPDTELSELRIRTDKDGDGISVGDPIYDTQLGGRGKDAAHGFQIVRVESSDGRLIDAMAEVEDGGQELVLRLSNFRAGDRLEFTIDVDEVLRDAIDLAVFNNRLDVITSGQEFQDSILEATFNAAHYEVSQVDAIFLNDYGTPSESNGLDLPPDQSSDVDSRPNRSAAAVATTVQVPKPVSISGYVWVDNDLDQIRETDEAPLAAVEIALWKLDPVTQVFLDTGHRASTNAEGRYIFAKSMGLSPGQYRVVESQPPGWYSVAAVAGTVGGVTSGRVESPDAIRSINLPLGDLSAINYDFAEAQPASLSGYVYLDSDHNGRRDSVETGIAGVRVQLVPINTIVPQSVLTVTTAADGSYSFTGLAPGRYEIIEIDQPANLNDGLDAAGAVNGQVVGVAENPGDRIREIVLAGNDSGIEYNFGEWPLGSLSGFVYLAAPGEDCSGHLDPASNMPLAGVQVALQTELGETVARTSTGADGGYLFENLAVGIYRIIQFTPHGRIDGKAHVGRIENVQVGTAVAGGLVQDITMTASGMGVEYNFCEAAPASISGNVYEDDSNDGHRDASEAGIADTTVTLVDAGGLVVARTTTDANGRYEFLGILPGDYTIVEEQPTGYLDGIDSVGTVRGHAVGLIAGENDTLTSILLKQGDEASEYNFGELLGATLAGRVHIDLDGDCELDDDEQTLAGVRIRLFSDAGIEVATTTTDAAGRYVFNNLAAGRFTLVQEQPDGFLDGDAHAGSAGGNAVDGRRIVNIELAPGEVAVDYNFCEVEPANISGVVFVDGNGDCLQDADEMSPEGATIELRDASGNRVAVTSTDADGRYSFNGLAPGDYQIVEFQPDGYFQGGQQLGSGGGEVLGDDHLALTLLGGTHVVDYDFCELAPSSIAGGVWQETDLNLQFDPDEQPIPGVLVELIDDLSQVVAQRITDSRGRFLFDSLAPGVYSVRETQPSNFFHGGQVVGSQGGRVAADDWLVGIVLTGGTDAVDYGFAELPPAVISGFVFRDGDPISSSENPAPTELREFKDGQLTADDHPLPGVVVELRNILGRPFTADRALPGAYGDGPIRTTTTANGYFEFVGLRPGTYHVYQLQPEDYFDGLDTPGTTGGLAVNPADKVNDPDDQAMIQALASSEQTDPHNDAILNIALAAGAHSRMNNFSEVLIARPQAAPVAPLPANQPSVIFAAPERTFESYVRVVAFSAASPSAQTPIIADDEWAVSWHLSVINGGFPRGEDDSAGVRGVSVHQMQRNWSEGEHASGRWTIVTRDGKRVELSAALTLGDPDAVALTGDFNGDGTDEATLYVRGQWFVDLNGNGRWDAGDLWIQLGTEMDRPVVGDWDGDGKDDIGIFGPQWQRDPQRIKRDPGLPDPDNMRRRQVDPRQLAAKHEDRGEDRQRLMRRGNKGSLRADVVDHVFRYGELVDTPVSGDWNGDGIDQIAVFRGGQWLLDVDGDGRWTAKDHTVDYGRPGDEPIVGDFNGDGIDEIGVVRGDVWIIDIDGDRRITANDLRIVVPRTSGDSQPAVGDFDGDGKDDPGYYDEAA